MSTETYTLIHVVISLSGIGSGLIVLFGLLTGKRLDSLTALFLTTTVLTSAENPGPENNGADPDRTAFFDRADRGDAALHRAWDFCRKKVSH